MLERWGLPVGLSDHTIGGTVAGAAVAIGACIVEKHIMASHKDRTADETSRSTSLSSPQWSKRSA